MSVPPFIPSAIRLGCALGFFAVSMADVSLAQNASDPRRPADPLRPLDQIVEDLGPARTSLRRVEPGLNTRNPQESRVYQQAGGNPQGSIDDSDRLIYLDQGINATFDRSRYLVNEEGVIFQGIPANTMFHLDSPDVPQPATTRPAGVVRPYQITGRSTTDRNSPSLSNLPTDQPEDHLAAARHHYHRAVLASLDRLIAADRQGGAESPTAAAPPAVDASAAP